MSLPHLPASSQWAPLIAPRNVPDRLRHHHYWPWITDRLFGSFSFLTLRDPTRACSKAPTSFYELHHTTQETGPGAEERGRGPKALSALPTRNTAMCSRERWCAATTRTDYPAPVIGLPSRQHGAAIGRITGGGLIPSVFALRGSLDVEMQTLDVTQLPQLDEPASTPSPPIAAGCS